MCFGRQRRSEAEAANAAVVTAAVMAVEPHLGRDVVAGCVAAAAPTRRRLTLLARSFTLDPECLTSGGSIAGVEVDRLVDALGAVGATRVRPPGCVECGCATHLAERHRGKRICQSCAARRRVEACDRCGRQRRVGRRQPDGSALCGSCDRAHPIRRRRCDGCGREAVISRRLADGTGLCRSCAGRPIVVCVTCGRTAACYGGIRRGQPRCEICSRPRRACAVCGNSGRTIAHLAAGPACSTCYEKALFAKADCSRCGRRRRPDPRVPGVMCSECAGLDPLQVCAECGDESRLYETGRCQRCALRRRVAALVAPAGDPLPAGLGALVAALVDTDRPKASLKWLARDHNRAFVAAVAAGEIELSHAGLDTLGATRAVDYLRSVLVAAAALPARDEMLVRFEAWIADHIAGIDIAEDRHLIDTYATWWVLRRYRARTVTRSVRTTKPGRSNILAATEMLVFLRGHGRSLATARQPDIDLWAATASDQRRRQGHDFLRWANNRRLTTTTILRRPHVLPAAHPELASDQRVALTRRLLHDDVIAVGDRVAGLLVLLYGQPLTKIVQLTVDDIDVDDSGASMRFGTEPVVMLEPLDQLLGRLVDQRTGRATVAAAGHRWLWPGGQAGRHLTPARLQIRLARLGLPARIARTNTLLALAADVPPFVLAELLDLHPITAVRWVRAAGGDWARYAAARLNA